MAVSSNLKVLRVEQKQKELLFRHQVAILYSQKWGCRPFEIAVIPVRRKKSQLGHAGVLIQDGDGKDYFVMQDAHGQLAKVYQDMHS